jgi:uncharacterized protein with PQ loop repeat
MTGYMSTTPTAAMETLMVLPSLQVVVEKEAIGDISLFLRWQRKISLFYWVLLTVYATSGGILWKISGGISL